MLFIKQILHYKIPILYQGSLSPGMPYCLSCGNSSCSFVLSYDHQWGVTRSKGRSRMSQRHASHSFSIRTQAELVGKLGHISKLPRLQMHFKSSQHKASSPEPAKGDVAAQVPFLFSLVSWSIFKCYLVACDSEVQSWPHPPAASAYIALAMRL